MKPSKLDPHEAWVLANATHFTTCIFRGRGQFDVVEHTTIDLAREAAKTLLPSTTRPVSIYAVFGVHQAHIENVQPERKRA